MIEIPRNTYEVPTECREKVVEGICLALLNTSVYHVRNFSAHRKGSDGVAFSRGRNEWGFCLFDYNEGETDTAFKFRGCEMKEAFRVLIDSGYHIFRVYQYGDWPGYKVYKTPYVPSGSCYENGAREVHSFSENIDY